MAQRKHDEEGFIEIRGRKSRGNGNGSQKNQEMNNKMANEKGKVNMQFKYRPKENARKTQNNADSGNQKNEEQLKTPKQVNNMENGSPFKKMWNVGTKNVEELKRSANSYVVLTDDEGNGERMCTEDNQKEIRDLILEEHLSICGVLETHLKAKRVNKIGNAVFVKRMSNCCEDNPFDTALKEKATKVLNEYLEVSNDELKLLQQKAKIKCLSEGDQNTDYFHGILKARKHKRIIESICDENGVRYEVDISFEKMLTDDEANEMIKLVTDEEIKDAIFDIDSNKASGHDRYTSRFFKKAWKVIGNEACLAVKDFFINGTLLGEVNATTIALIPKTKVSNKVFEFRPIACKFKYHYRRKEIKLSNMCFADDLLILCNGDAESVEVTKKSMEPFSSISGLFPNIGKSTIFFGSVPLSIQIYILKSMPFQLGNLPMRYLGVPLIAKKLSVNDCKNLVEKVDEKINCSRNRMLTYARRIQLIASVLSSMQIYWASVYMLPDLTIKEIKKLLKGFLWCQGPLTNGKAKVAWKVVYLPKDQEDWELNL
nr:reverse transcriptase domain, reverse transcriptase zinc-binding domain protein [Tanacetum cinerariifolium]